MATIDQLFNIIMSAKDLEEGISSLNGSLTTEEITFSDFNTSVNRIWAYVPESTAKAATNAPNGTNTLGGFLQVIQRNENFIVQTYYERGSGGTPSPKMYIRIKWSGTWQQWAEK